MNMDDFQQGVLKWGWKCFGTDMSDRKERRDRFLEEAFELYFAAGGNAADAIELLHYTSIKPANKDVSEEIGDVLVTASALASSESVPLALAAEIAVHRVNANVEKIREKHKAKPRNSPLPGLLPAELAKNVAPSSEYEAGAAYVEAQQRAKEQLKLDQTASVIASHVEHCAAQVPQVKYILDAVNGLLDLCNGSTRLENMVGVVKLAMDDARSVSMYIRALEGK